MFGFSATAEDVYATLHVVVVDDVLVSRCSSEYIRKIEEILKVSCVRYYTIQFEYIPTEMGSHEECLYQLRRNRRGHSFTVEDVKII